MIDRLTAGKIKELLQSLQQEGAIISNIFQKNQNSFTYIHHTELDALFDDKTTLKNQLELVEHVLITVRTALDQVEIYLLDLNDIIERCTDSGLADMLREMHGGITAYSQAFYKGEKRILDDWINNVKTALENVERDNMRSARVMMERIREDDSASITVIGAIENRFKQNSQLRNELHKLSSSGIKKGIGVAIGIAVMTFASWASGLFESSAATAETTASASSYASPSSSAKIDFSIMPASQFAEIGTLPTGQIITQNKNGQMITMNNIDKNKWLGSDGNEYISFKYPFGTKNFFNPVKTTTASAKPAAKENINLPPGTILTGEGKSVSGLYFARSNNTIFNLIAFQKDLYVSQDGKYIFQKEGPNFKCIRRFDIVNANSLTPFVRLANELKEDRYIFLLSTDTRGAEWLILMEKIGDNYYLLNSKDGIRHRFKLSDDKTILTPVDVPVSEDNKPEEI